MIINQATEYMKKILFYLIIACIIAVMPKTVNAAEAYAALSNDNTTLTFYYDNQKTSRNGMSIGPFESKSDRGWDECRKDILTVVFDDSFAQYTDLQSTVLWFGNLTNLTSIKGIENLKTNNVTDMSGMFSGCESLASIDVSNFDTRNVKNMSLMFCECRSLSFINLRNFDTQNVTDMTCMFCECHTIETIDISSFNTEKVTSMYAMFEVCKSLKNVNVSGLNTSNVTNIRKMFSRCLALTTLDLSGFNTSSVTDMRNMFSNDSVLTTVYVSDKWSTAKVDKGDGAFANCFSIVGGSGTKWDETHTDHTYAHIDGGPSNPGYLTYTEEDETSITEIKHDSTYLKTEYYNLTGNKLSGDPKKGIYIKNGKKYLK